MAILRSVDGKFYDIDDADLEKHQIKPEEIPQEARTKQGSGDRSQSPRQGAQGPQGANGRNAAVSPVTIVINMLGDGQSSGPMPNVQMKASLNEGGRATDADGQDADGQDVEGRWWRNCWANYWRNCWRNCF